LENMINIKAKRCLYVDCKIQPSYNYPRTKKSIYCASHKLENMIDIRTKRCIENGCEKHPSFNYETEKTADYCILHKLDNMINIKKRRHYINKRDNVMVGIFEENDRQQTNNKKQRIE